MPNTPHISNSEAARNTLYNMWKDLERPKPPWKSFKRLAEFSHGDIKRAVHIWRKTIDQ